MKSIIINLLLLILFKKMFCYIFSFRDISRGTERFPIRVINDVDDELPAEFTYSTRVVDRTGILKQRKTDEMLVSLGGGGSFF